MVQQATLIHPLTHQSLPASTQGAAGTTGSNWRLSVQPKDTTTDQEGGGGQDLNRQPFGHGTTHSASWAPVDPVEVIFLEKL